MTRNTKHFSKELETRFVSIVKQFTDLEWKGTYWLGKCPIHDDNNPSFVIYPNKGDGDEYWKCFSCSPSGGRPEALIEKLDGSLLYEEFRPAEYLESYLVRQSEDVVSLPYLASTLKNIRDLLGFDMVEKLSESIDLALYEKDFTEVRYLISRALND